MTVEASTYINTLNASYPAATDPKSEGDDHIRAIKSAVKLTFPNVTGAVTATQSELNSVTEKVTGPASATANAIAKFDGTTGKLMKVSGVVEDAAGNVGVGSAPGATSGRSIDLNGVTLQPLYILRASSLASATALWTLNSANSTVDFISSDFGTRWIKGATTQMTLDASGNLLVGATSTTAGSIFQKSVTNDAGQGIIDVRNGSGTLSLGVTGVTGTGYSVTASAIYINKAGNTSRSINAAGTVNQNGADYAEYEHNNGLIITKGALVGFKADGTLTLTYSEAVRFAVKSTDPGLVGGDTWGSEAKIGKRPEQPAFAAPAYTGPAAPGDEPTAPADDADEAAIEAYAQAHAVWNEAFAAHEEAMAEHTGAVAAAQAEFDDVELAAYNAELAAFEARLEAARQLVDRIAYSGKVPCNVQGATPGDYVVATAAADGSITGVSVAEPDFAQYRKAVGRVNRLLPDGRCEVAVIIH